MRDPERPGTRWFFAAPDGTRGPLTADEVRSLVQRGELRADSQVRVTGAQAWTAAALDPELAEMFAPPPGAAVRVHGPLGADFGLSKAEEPSSWMLRTAVLAMVRQGGDRVELILATRNVCQLVDLGGLARTLLHVVRFRPGAAAGVVEELRAGLQVAGNEPVDLILVGGRPADRELLASATSKAGTTRVGLLHVADDGQSWSDRTNLAKALLLPWAEKTARVDGSAQAFEALHEQARARHTQRAMDAEAVAAFARQLARRRPLATYCIVAVIAVMFCIEMLLGGPTQPVLRRMGALDAARIADGEWWRLFTCTLLHASWLHVALNGFALFSLGSFLERFLGHARFIVLYGVSALAGSLGSAWLGAAGLSVGASGAIWGLLLVDAALVLHPKTVLPRAMIARARSAAGYNIAVNVLISFLPHVDMWAHFAGGAAGIAFALAGYVSPAPAADDGRAGIEGRPLGGSVRSRAAAIVGGAVLLLTAGAALTLSKPFDVRSDPRLRRTPLAELGVSLMLPPQLIARPADPQKPTERSFGAIDMDPMVVLVKSVTVDAMDDAARASAAASVKSGLQAPERSRQVKPPASFDAQGNPGVIASYLFTSGAVLERAFVVLPRHLVSVEVLRWQAHARAAPDGIAQTIASSTQPL